jgi:hypothetical protein
MAEAREEAAIRLWPQPWPISGRASGGVSISPHIVIFVSALRATYHTQHYSKLFDHLPSLTENLASKAVSIP